MSVTVITEGRTNDMKWRLIATDDGEIDVQCVDFRGEWKDLHGDFQTRAPY